MMEEGTGNTTKRVNKQGLLRELGEKHQDIEWTGEIFRVKPMKLYRLNLSSMKSLTAVAVANVQVHRCRNVLKQFFVTFILQVLATWPNLILWHYSSTAGALIKVIQL